uniref:NIF system FeS cluster assembly NifU N-terminal domain-containing protein n=1 Tax=Phocoena sinus TaxID=42100 RepID=A0A8C9CEL0_PHOSS
MAAAGAGRMRRATSALLLRDPRLPVRELSAPARLYHKKVVDHYENPRNVGSLDKTSKNVGTGLVGAPACGDVMKLQIQVDEKGKIVDARFKTFGCGSAIASSSLATEWVKGKTAQVAGLKQIPQRLLPGSTPGSWQHLCGPGSPQLSNAGGGSLDHQKHGHCQGAVPPACETALLHAGRRCHQGRPG